MKDLSQNPAYREVLLDMRRRMTAKVKGINDLSFYPESHMVAHALEDGIGFGKNMAGRLKSSWILPIFL